MSGFLYYISGGEHSLDYEGLVELGLGHAFDRPGRGPAGRAISAATVCPVSSGPDGQRGVVVAHDSRVRRIRYEPDVQTWEPSRLQATGYGLQATAPEARSPKPEARSPKPDARSPKPEARIWLGWYTEDRPTPRDLARAKMIDGHTVELADGNEWLVPLARAWVDLSRNGEAGAGDAGGDASGNAGWLTTLPQTVGLDESGDWAPTGVIAPHLALWDLATRYWDALLDADSVADSDGERITFDFAGLHDGAALALQTNYYLSKAEIGALWLFETTSAREVLLALVDFRTVEVWLKKKAQALEPKIAPTAPDRAGRA